MATAYYTSWVGGDGGGTSKIPLYQDQRISDLEGTIKNISFLPSADYIIQYTVLLTAGVTGTIILLYFMGG